MREAFCSLSPDGTPLVGSNEAPPWEVGKLFGTGSLGSGIVLYMVGWACSVLLGCNGRFEMELAGV